jgi:amino acid adenylation domain-containing protein
MQGNLYDLLSRSAIEHPRNTAVVNPGKAAASYEELERRAGEIANLLNRAGVTEGDRVAICAPKSIGTVASIFSILKVGAAYVPVDSTAPSRRNAEILTDCSVKTVVADVQRAEILRRETEVDPKIVGELPSFGSDEPSLSLWEWPVQATAAEKPLKDMAYILYTSGSTGKPKGVVHTHGSALSFIDWCSAEFAPTAADRFSSHAPFHFDLSILDLFLPIKHGAAVVLIGEEAGKQPLQLAGLIRDEELTVWYSTPSILRLLVEYGRLQPGSCLRLRLVLFAGEVFPMKHLHAVRALWPHPRYYNLYGPTETNVCTYHEVPRDLPADQTEPLPIGRACSADELKLIGADGREVQGGDEGELLVSGGSVTLGYWNRPQQTEKAFFIDPAKRSWYRTGDIVADKGNGVLRFIGRRDRMVKRRGYRVELGEIEAALHRHPDIQEAAIVAAPDAESGVLIKAFLACSGGGAPSIVELKQFCAGNLPLYMIPDRFHVLPELPKTSTDKIDYQTLSGLA